MKLKLTLCFAVVLLCGCHFLGAQVIEQPEVDEKPYASGNLVTNPGFEDGIKSWVIPTKAQASIDDAVFYGGKVSLGYKRDDRNEYNFIYQTITAKPGTKLHFGAYIKGKNIQGHAAVFMQSSGKNHRYLGGSFPAGKSGTFDWELVKGMYSVPADATTVQVGLLIKKGGAGAAWFDDVYVYEDSKPSFQAFLKNYRGVVNRSGNIPMTAILEVNTPSTSKSISVHSLLKNPAGKVLLEEEKELTVKDHKARLEILPQKSWEIGDYHWDIKVLSPKDQYQKQFLVKVRDEMPHVYIDADGFTVIDGERFFPFGIYTGRSNKTKNPSLHSSAEDLRRMSDARFNTVLSYPYGVNRNQQGQNFLNAASQHHLKVLYSLAGNYFFDEKEGHSRVKEHVKALKESPALLAWYINDEKEKASYLADTYRIITDTDSDHPVYQVLYQVHLLDNFYRSTDVLGTDPYPIRATTNLARVAQWTQMTKQSARDVKGVWQVLQIHNFGYFGDQYPDRDPTLNEMRNMSYQALINGAKGLLYYAYHSLYYDFDKAGNVIYSKAAFNKRWADIQKLSQEIEPITDVILTDQKVDLKVLSPSSVQYQAWKYQGKLYVMAVNTSEDKPKSLKLQIPSGWRLSDNTVPGIKSHISGDILSLDFDPVASGIIVLER